MRLVGLLVSVLVAVSGCKGKGDEGGGEADPTAVRAQQELVAKREALLAARDKLQKDREAAEIELRSVQDQGGDPTAAKKKLDDIDAKLAQQTQQVDTTSTELDKISSTLAAQGGMASREASLASREARLAERERALTDRATKLVEMEAKSAERWKEGCSVGSTQTIIQQVPAAKDGKYSRKEVDVLLGRAKTQMTKKGLVAADLGPQSSLEGEATKAMNEQDWARAYVLANQLAATVDAIKIDRPFIKAKFDRLQSRVRASKVDEATGQQLTAGVSEISAMFGSGDFVAVNRKINQIATLLR